MFAGLSQEMWQFVLARGLQGLGGGAVFPIALAVIADLYPPEERAKYGALFGAVFGLSSVLGPLIGGGITDAFGWPWIFFVNVPLGLISLFVCWRLLPAIKHPESGPEHRLRRRGAASRPPSARSWSGLTNKQSADWTDPWVGGLMLLGLVIGAVFVWWETRAADPIVHLELFRNRSFTISVASMFLAAFGFFGAVIFLPRWFQAIAGHERDRVRAGAAAARDLAHRERDPGRADRRPNAALQAADLRLDGAARVRAVPDDEPPRGHGVPDPVAVDDPRRPGHRTVVRGLHRARPEHRGAADGRVSRRRA